MQILRQINAGTALLFCTLTLSSTSCNGQSTARKQQHEPVVQASALAAADTVSALDKSMLIVFEAKDDTYWFGSDTEGIFRYDGRAIVHYTLKGGLWNNRVREIQEDGSGAIYFTTTGGVTRFDGSAFTALAVSEKDSFKRMKLSPEDLWFKAKPGENGAYRYDGKKLLHLEFPKHEWEDAIFARQHPPPPYSPYEVYSIYKDSKGDIWFGTATLGIYRFDGKSLGRMYEKHLTDIDGGGSFGIRSIIEDRAGKYWFCNTRFRYSVSANSADGLIPYRKEKGVEDYDGDNLIYFMWAVEDDAGHLWMATYNQGVWRYDGKKMTRYAVMDGDKEATVYSIYKDRKGTLWLGTHNSGAYKFNGEAFEKFRP